MLAATRSPRIAPFSYAFVWASVFSFACVPSGGAGEEGGDGGPATQSGATPDASGSSGGDALTWWGDVEPLVARECGLCHGAAPRYGAPMPLADYEDVVAPAWSDAARPTHELMAKRLRPLSGKAVMPPSTAGMLSEEEIRLIERWSEAGAPEGVRGGQKPDSGEPTPEPDAGPMDPDGPYENLDVLAPDALVRAGSTDDYACFRTILQLDEPVDAVELSPVIDEATVVHHILVFRDRGRNYPAQRSGFLCAADTIAQNDWELLHGWAPGGNSAVMPPDAGVRLQNGDYIVVQLHYNNPTANTVRDASGIRFKTTKRLRANEASSVGVGVQNFSLPPGQSAISRTGECTITSPLTIFAHNPHMHLLGRGAKLELVRANGASTMLADMTGFSFDSQALFPLPSTTLQPGDKLRATCTWDTTGRTGTTAFGEGTTDEMCYIFVYHYPTMNRFTCLQ